MTIILLTVLVTIIMAFFFYKPIRSYRYFLYLFFVILTIILGGENANVLNMGYVPFGVFLVVMIPGVMDKGTLKKRLLSVRAELAIIGTIMIASHSLSYLEYYLDDIGLLHGDISFYLGLFAMILVIPLTLTSFPVIRKKMGYKNWKKLHQLSYVFYLAVGFHLILIQNDRMILYILIFGTYFALKVGTLLFNKKSKQTKSVKLS
jgi:DMSO/TMAO reductase YedYZ heme-binding membrane subunit